MAEFISAVAWFVICAGFFFVAGLTYLAWGIYVFAQTVWIAICILCGWLRLD